MAEELKLEENIEQKTITHSKDEEELIKFLDKREKELKEARENVFGQNIHNLMVQADKDIKIGERIEKDKGVKAFVDNEELGWRGTSRLVSLGNNKWQSQESSNEAYVKVMTALSILFDNRPEAKLNPASKKYVATTEIFKQLFESSWEVQHSIEQMRAFIFDLAKYGWAIGRTFIKQETRTVKEIVEYDPETRVATEEEKELQDFATVIRKRLNPHKTWIDNKAKANDKDSINDWMWEEDYGWDKLEAEFGDTDNFNQVMKGGSKLEDDDNEVEKEYEEDIYTVQFYENKYKDRFIARIKSNGKWVILVDTPLPYDHKQLSLWPTYWNLRHPDTIYGVGLLELMRSDTKLKNKIKNMTIDQLVLSIYKMGFIEDKKEFGNQRNIKIEPGKFLVGGKVNWMEVPGPGKDAQFGLDWIQGEIDKSTGVTPTLEGQVTGKTAFEVGQAKESALKRLRLPMDNIVYALNLEAELSIDLIYQSYTIPMVEHIADTKEIENYRKEVGEDPQFFYIDEDGQFFARRFKEFSIKAKENEEGIYVPDDENKFFGTMPQFIRWRGEIKITASSIVSLWKEIEKNQVLQFTNTLIPLLQLPSEIAKKPASQLCKKFEFSPKDWLPDAWLDPMEDRSVKMASDAEQMFGRENLPGNMQETLNTAGIKPPQPVDEAPTSTAVSQIT